MVALPFTVFTPTYNRAHTLTRVFNSLCLQSPQLFEWLIVDDGSTDNTSDLLKELSTVAPFPVRVIRQPNGGKHRAHNVAIKVAQGELTVILDSDDELTPGALEVLWTQWNAIPLEDRSSIAGILGHSISPSNTNVGARYPAQYIDGKQFALVASRVLVGEKLPCYRTEVLRHYPFPERAGCNELVVEGIVWTAISRKWRVRCIDKAVRIYHSDSNDPIALMNSCKRADSNAWGSMQYCLVILNSSVEYLPKFFIIFAKAAVNCTRFALHSRSGLFYPASQVKGVIPWMFWALGFPFGLLVWMMDRIKFTGDSC